MHESYGDDSDSDTPALCEVSSSDESSSDSDTWPDSDSDEEVYSTKPRKHQRQTVKREKHKKKKRASVYRYESDGYDSDTPALVGLSGDEADDSDGCPDLTEVSESDGDEDDHEVYFKKPRKKKRPHTTNCLLYTSPSPRDS